MGKGPCSSVSSKGGERRRMFSPGRKESARGSKNCPPAVTSGLFKAKKSEQERQRETYRCTASGGMASPVISTGVLLVSFHASVFLHATVQMV